MRLFYLLCPLLIAIAQADLSGPNTFHFEGSQAKGGFSNSSEQPVRKLKFYLENIPQVKPDPKAKLRLNIQWEAVTKESPHISLSNLRPGGDTIAIKYHSRKDIENQVVRAESLLIVVSKDKGYQPLMFVKGDPGITARIEAEPLTKIGTAFYVVVTTFYSGSGGHRQVAYLKLDSGSFKLHELWSDSEKEKQFKAEIKKAGWDYWHRGHWKDHKKAVAFNHVYRSSEKQSEPPHGHAWIKTSYRWENDQLIPDSWKVVEEPD